MKITKKPEEFNKYDLNLFRGLSLAYKICLALNILALVVLQFTSGEAVIESKPWRTFAPILAGIGSFSFTFLLLYNSVRSLGLSAGKERLGPQIWVVTKRLTLYMFLPSIFLTALLLLIGYIAYRH